MLTSSVFVFLFSAAFFLATTSSFLQNDSVVAQEILDTQTDEGEASNESATEEDAVVEEAPAAYTYEAQPGDSYTLMARKAVQTFGLVEEVNLSAAQIIFVETNLTQLAGAPMLDVGEVVDIEQASVSDWAQRATELSESEEAAWESYASDVDFNTDNVGENQTS